MNGSMEKDQASKRKASEDGGDEPHQPKIRKSEGNEDRKKTAVGTTFWAPLVGWWNHVPPYAIPYGAKVTTLMVEGRIAEIREEGKRFGLVFPVFGEDVVEKSQAYLDQHAFFGALPDDREQLTREMVQQYEKETNDVPEMTTKPLEEKDEIYLKQMGIDALIGTKLEVLWDTQDEETGKSDHTWFLCELEGLVDPATATCLSSTKKSKDEQKEEEEEEQRIWLLRYAAHGDFSETVHRCQFIDRATLRDLEFQSDLTWRLEGQAVDRTAMQMSLSKMVVSMVQVLQSQAQIEEEEGENLEQYAAEELQKFPFYVQQVMASVYRNFADSLKQSLRKRMETLVAEGKEAIITVQDIGAIMAEVKSSQPIQIPSYL